MVGLSCNDLVLLCELGARASTPEYAPMFTYNSHEFKSFKCLKCLKCLLYNVTGECFM